MTTTDSTQNGALESKVSAFDETMPEMLAATYLRNVGKTHPAGAHDDLYTAVKGLFRDLLDRYPVDDVGFGFEMGAAFGVAVGYAIGTLPPADAAKQIELAIQAHRLRISEYVGDAVDERVRRL